MDFALNDEQLEFKARCRKFAREVPSACTRKRTVAGSLPALIASSRSEALRVAGSNGLTGSSTCPPPLPWARLPSSASRSSRQMPP